MLDFLCGLITVLGAFIVVVCVLCALVLLKMMRMMDEEKGGDK